MESRGNFSHPRASSSSSSSRHTGSIDQQTHTGNTNPHVLSAILSATRHHRLHATQQPAKRLSTATAERLSWHRGIPRVSVASNPAHIDEHSSFCGSNWTKALVVLSASLLKSSNNEICTRVLFFRRSRRHHVGQRALLRTSAHTDRLLIAWKTITTRSPLPLQNGRHTKHKLLWMSTCQTSASTPPTDPNHCAPDDERSTRSTSPRRAAPTTSSSTRKCHRSPRSPTTQSQVRSRDGQHTTEVENSARFGFGEGLRALKIRAPET